jgi:hypothetical protein
MVGMMLGNFLDGMLKGDSVWRVLEQQRYGPRRSRPNLGSGGFGRRRPRGGGFGGGGFGTGGGF